MIASTWLRLLVIAFAYFCLLLLAFICCCKLLLDVACCCLLLLALRCFCLLCTPLLWYPGHMNGICPENDTRAAAGHPKRDCQNTLPDDHQKNTFLTHWSQNARSSPAQAPLKPLLKPFGEGGRTFRKCWSVNSLHFRPWCTRGTARRSGAEEARACCELLLP